IAEPISLRLYSHAGSKRRSALNLRTSERQRRQNAATADVMARMRSAALASERLEALSRLTESLLNHGRGGPPAKKGFKVTQRCSSEGGWSPAAQIGTG